MNKKLGLYKNPYTLIYEKKKHSQVYMSNQVSSQNSPRKINYQQQNQRLNSQQEYDEDSSYSNISSNTESHDCQECIKINEDDLSQGFSASGGDSSVCTECAQIMADLYAQDYVPERELYNIHIGHQHNDHQGHNINYNEPSAPLHQIAQSQVGSYNSNNSFQHQTSRSVPKRFKSQPRQSKPRYISQKKVQRKIQTPNRRINPKPMEEQEPEDYEQYMTKVDTIVLENLKKKAKEKEVQKNQEEIKKINLEQRKIRLKMFQKSVNDQNKKKYNKTTDQVQDEMQILGFKSNKKLHKKEWGAPTYNDKPSPQKINKEKAYKYTKEQLEQKIHQKPLYKQFEQEQKISQKQKNKILLEQRKQLFHKKNDIDDQYKQRVTKIRKIQQEQQHEHDEEQKRCIYLERQDHQQFQENLQDIRYAKDKQELLQIPFPSKTLKSTQKDKKDLEFSQKYDINIKKSAQKDKEWKQIWPEYISQFQVNTLNDLGNFKKKEQKKQLQEKKKKLAQLEKERKEKLRNCKKMTIEERRLKEEKEKNDFFQYDKYDKKENVNNVNNKNKEYQNKENFLQKTIFNEGNEEDHQKQLDQQQQEQLDNLDKEFVKNLLKQGKILTKQEIEEFKNRDKEVKQKMSQIMNNLTHKQLEVRQAEEYNEEELKMKEELLKQKKPTNQEINQDFFNELMLQANLNPIQIPNIEKQEIQYEDMEYFKKVEEDIKQQLFK